MLIGADRYGTLSGTCSTEEMSVYRLKGDAGSVGVEFKSTWDGVSLSRTEASRGGTSPTTPAHTRGGSPLFLCISVFPSHPEFERRARLWVGNQK